MAETVTQTTTTERAVKFREHVEALETVERVERAFHEGDIYWRVVPKDPIIPHEVSAELGRHGLDAMLDDGSLLVRVDGLVFEGDEVGLIQEAIGVVQSHEDADPIEMAEWALEAAESDLLADHEMFEGAESASDIIGGVKNMDRALKILFFDRETGDPAIDPDADLGWIVIGWPFGKDDG